MRSRAHRDLPYLSSRNPCKNPDMENLRFFGIVTLEWRFQVSGFSFQEECRWSETGNLDIEQEETEATENAGE